MSSRSKDSHSGYREWYASAEAKKLVIENIRKSGIPLELQARKVLKDNGFRVASARYLEPTGEELELPTGYGEGTWRELDIHASRSEEASINIDGCDIRFATHILGECKYSTEKDIFVFEYLDRENADLGRFALRANGQCIMPFFQAKDFRLPLLVERVTEAMGQNALKKEGNWSDAITHRACEQILSALRFFLARQREFMRRHYLQMASQSIIKEKWDVLLRTEEVPYETSGPISKVPDGFISKFLRDKFDSEMLKDFSYLPIHIFFPILVTDESRGIIKVNLDESYNITDLEDVGSCLYLYVSENANYYKTVLENSFALPVFLCSLPHLNDVLKMIEEASGKLIESTRRYVTANPDLIAKEIVFSDTISVL